jgi:hypothetical protein
MVHGKPSSRNFKKWSLVVVGLFLKQATFSPRIPVVSAASIWLRYSLTLKEKACAPVRGRKEKQAE